MKLLAIAGALVALLLTAATAAAAPDNKNTGSFDVSCEGIGTITVSTIEQSQGSTVFTEDGQALVAKRISATGETTFTINGEVVAAFPNDFEEGAKGSGLDDRLTACDFTITFEDEFTLNKRAAQSLELDPSLIGETVHVSSTISGTAWVLMPGQQ